MFVNERFELKSASALKNRKPNFGYDGFGELLFYTRYSRNKNGKQESWADTIIRVVEGTFSIRKDWYLKNHIKWHENYWQDYASEFALDMYDMYWLPPGRGLYAMGTDFVYERGSMALYNCAFTKIRGTHKFANDLSWLMDSLMCGVGVGFNPTNEIIQTVRPNGEYTFVVPDTREGWCELIWRLCRAYVEGDKKPKPDFSLVRPKGLPIKGFGGISSGPEPLEWLYHNFDKQLMDHIPGNETIFKTNLANMIGCTVVAGNVRRSAEIACKTIKDRNFLDLKDYNKYPERAEWGWMSNNSAILEDDEDFSQLGEIAQRVIHNGEPGIINLKNLKYARIGKSMKGLRPDRAEGFNPCGEIPLEHREVCNLAETFPTVCPSVKNWYRSCEHAAFYCSTVSLLPTHQPSTNRVVARNRRIGVGIVDYTGFVKKHGVHKVIKYLRDGYETIRKKNKEINEEAGVPEAIRVTTCKPGGTVPKLPGKTSGIGFPTFRHTVRRIRQQQGSPVHEFLVKHGVPFEKDFYSMNTDVFSFPILQGPAKTAEEVSLWEQAINLITVQREWADNAVSNTLYFRPKWQLSEVHEEDCEERLYELLGAGTSNAILRRQDKEYTVLEFLKLKLSYSKNTLTTMEVYMYDREHEEDIIETVISSITPLIKSLSLLPHTPNGVYKQMPEEGISEKAWKELKNRIEPIDWSTFNGSDGSDERYCTSEYCEWSP